MQNDNINHNDHTMSKENLQESTIVPSLTNRDMTVHNFKFKGETYRWSWNVKKNQPELWKQNDTMHNIGWNPKVNAYTATSGDGRSPIYTVDLRSLTKICTLEEKKMLYNTKYALIRQINKQGTLDEYYKKKAEQFNSYI
jgi:hypothetical protein